MAKNSADYWRDREATQRKRDIVDRMAYNREIRRIYQSTLDNVQKEIDAFYGKYAQKEGITLAEAKRRVSAIDFEAYERKAKRYVEAASRDRKEGTKDRAGYYFSDQANEEMRLYNLTMKVNRLELLKANIGLELVDGFDHLNETFDEKLTRHATKEYERLAGILGDSVRNNAQYAHAIVNASFHNATFSDRIWTYQASLKAALDTQIQRGLIQGKNSIELARAIRREFDVSRKDAERLMITEMRRVRTEVAKQSYEENGNKEYQFLALGARPCDKCLDIDGQVFPVKDMMPGTNAPPMHPRCECTTAPYWDEDKFQRWLDSGAAADGVPWAEFEAEQNSVENGADSGILNEADKKAIQDYISSGVAYPLNDALRTGRALTPEQESVARNLDSALSKLPDYKGTVHRSLTSDYMDNSDEFWEAHQPGNVVQYPAFTSSSHEVYDDSMDIQITIKSKHGKDISAINAMEKEIIFRRNSLFAVTKIDDSTIYMEEL